MLLFLLFFALLPSSLLYSAASGGGAAGGGGAARAHVTTEEEKRLIAALTQRTTLAPLNERAKGCLKKAKLNESDVWIEVSGMKPRAFIEERTKLSVATSCVKRAMGDPERFLSIGHQAEFHNLFRMTILGIVYLNRQLMKEDELISKAQKLSTFTLETLTPIAVRIEEKVFSTNAEYENLLDAMFEEASEIRAIGNPELNLHLGPSTRDDFRSFLQDFFAGNLSVFLKRAKDSRESSRRMARRSPKKRFGRS